MRNFLEFKGQSIRLAYDRERAEFVLKAGPHPFAVHKPAAETEVKHNGNGTEPASRRKW
ncbi:hypothetical protein [Methyloceanibacter sp.]|uniref:hypothetical protein n=1 Tax=Methyloceanibacter sp. TaxID=1965321 RepID=UPI003D6D565D